MKFLISVFAATVFLGLFVQEIRALNCATTSVGANGCTGATYCQAQWLYTGSTYRMIYAVCIKSTYPLQTGWMFTSQGALEFTCNFADNCNQAFPPSPGPIRPTQPPPITCLQRVNSGPTSQCTANVCSVTQSGSSLTQQCDYSNTLTQKLSVNPKWFCTYTKNSGTSSTQYKCACNNAPNCNTQNLINTGMSLLGQLPTVTCWTGTTNSANALPQYNANGQFCQNSTMTTNGIVTVQFTAAATTFPVPSMGCMTIYGYKSGVSETTCSCNSYLCNGLSQVIATTQRPITGFPTMSSTFTIRGSVVATLVAALVAFWAKM